MRLVGLISGGKDSLYSMLQCIAAGHEVVAVANIEPHNKEELDSYMYQSVGQEAVSLIAAALALPIYRQKTKGNALCRTKTYIETSQDEVEDLLALLTKVKQEVQIEGVSVGAIASDYQRTRVESVCGRLNLKCFAYLWRRCQEELLQEMIDAELEAIIIKVASIGLNPDIHLGMNIKDVRNHLMELNQKFGVNVCGEGGEYETLTIDCPLYHRMIDITDSEKVILSNDAFAPVAFLNVKNADLKAKVWGNKDPVLSLESRLNHIQSIVKNPYSYVQDCVDDIFPQRPVKGTSETLPFPFNEENALEKQANVPEYWKKPSSLSQLPHSSQKVSFSPSTIMGIDTTICSLNYSSGWCCLANVTGSTIGSVFVYLQKHLERIKYDYRDIVFVSIYAKDMSDFSNMNKTYSQYMPETMPPARVCVATHLPPDVGFLVIVVAHKMLSKSQRVLYSTHNSVRETMHVQSISHWAPANIGPYSQCVKVGGLYYLAGQIPLIPGTMEILNKPILHQCKLTLRHVLRVMKAMNEQLNYSNVLQATCYATSEEIAMDIPSLWTYITESTNATVTSVVVSDLPKNAQLEWEVLAGDYETAPVIEEVQLTGEYFVQMKKCVFKESFASSMVCEVSFPKKTSKSQRNLNGITLDGVQATVRKCLGFLKKDNVGIPLCMLRLFYKSSETEMANVIAEITKSSFDYKVVATGIPVVACRNPDIFLTVTGVCH